MVLYKKKFLDKDIPKSDIQKYFTGIRSNDDDDYDGNGDCDYNKDIFGDRDEDENIQITRHGLNQNIPILGFITIW